MKRRCSECGKMVNIDKMVDAIDQRINPMCIKCAKRHLNKCEDSDYWYVNRCNGSKHRPKSVIPDRESWRSRKIPKLIGKPPYAGFEIEIELYEDTYDKIQSIYDKYKFIYTKYDGSLRSNIELVTEPISIDLLLNGKYHEIISTMLVELKQAGAFAEGSTTAGLHIHVSRDLFTTGELYKLFTFFAVNKNRIIEFARRHKSEVNQWAAIGTHEPLIRKIVTSRSHERHSAINLNNLNTIEFRIFKGTLNPLTFWKNLQFIIAVKNFLKDKPMHKMFKNAIEYKWENFVDYVLRNEKGELHRYVRYYS